jgi:hypothetical protein
VLKTPDFTTGLRSFVLSSPHGCVAQSKRRPGMASGGME